MKFIFTFLILWFSTLLYSQQSFVNSNPEQIVIHGVFDILSKRIIYKNVELAGGKHTIRAEGLGSAGIKLFRISGNDISITKKMVQLDGSSEEANLEIITSTGSLIKNKLLEDSLEIIISSPGYKTETYKVKVVPDIQQDYVLQQNPINLNASVNGYIRNMQTGENVPNANVIIKADTSTVKNVLTNSAGNFNAAFPYKIWMLGQDTIKQYSTIDILLFKNGYNPLEFNGLQFGAVTNIDTSLDKIPYITEFKSRGFNVHGEPINIPFKLKIRDSIQTVIKGIDGYYHFTFTDYKDIADTSAKIWHESPDFAKYIIGRKPGQKQYEKNLFQNSITGDFLVNKDPDTTSISLEKMNLLANKDSSDIYLMPMWYTNASGVHVSFRDTLTSLIDNSYLPGTEKFQGEYQDLMVLSYDPSNGNPVDTSIFNTMMFTAQNHKQAFTLSNGEVLGDIRIFTVNSPIDSIYQACQQRGWDNSITIYKIAGTPANSHRINTIEGRIISGYAHVNSNNVYDAGEEMHGAITTSDDTFTGQSSKVYIMEGGATGRLNDAGKALLRFVYLVDGKTRVYQ